MGDHVSVTLTVPFAQLDAALAIIDQHDGAPDSTSENDVFVDLEFSEVNYGNLESERRLTAAGIAWMKTWGRGGGFNGGTGWAMFREDGSLNTLNLQDAPPDETLSTFFALLDEPAALIEALAIERDKMRAPAWDHQVEYGKRYLTARLIDPPMLIDVTDNFPPP